MQSIDHLMTFIENSASPFHTAEHAAGRLLAAGFTPLTFQEPWRLERGGAYFCRPFSSGLFAFKFGSNFEPHSGVHLAAAHTDAPCLRIKPSASYTKGGYLQADAEIYGGPMLPSFFDRPLSLAGKLVLKSGELLRPEVRYIDAEKPLLTVPNIAIHMNRRVNDEGQKIDKQVHLMPLLGTVEDVPETENYLLDYIAGIAGVRPEDILDYELCAYNCEKPCFLGIDDSFISAPRLDDTTSVSAAIDGLIDSRPKKALAMTALFDHEEVGSSSRQGAHSDMMMFVLEKIWDCFGLGRIRCLEDLSSGMILSADVAHGYHPNFPGKYDTINQPVLGQGFCIKADSNQRYTWDSEAVGALEQICRAFEIPYQRCVKRTGESGGGTIGPMLAAKLPVRTVDIGVPILSMHSARELMGAKDQEYLMQVMKAFFSV